MSAQLEKIGQDFRFAARMLWKKKSFAIFAITTLAIGIGVSIAIFSVANSVLFEPIPYPGSEKLALIWTTFSNGGQARVPATGRELLELQQRSKSFTSMAGVWSNVATLTGNGEPEQVRTGFVTPNFFATLGIRPALGRSFTDDEVRASRFPAVMLSDGIWRRRYGADPNIVGKTVQISGAAVTVVGVLPASFQVIFPPDASIPEDLQIWVPLGDLARMPRDQGFIRMIGRLRDGVSPYAAQAELKTFATQLRGEFKEFATQGLDLEVVALHRDVVKDVRPALLALLGAVGLVMLIACANVANLVMTRTNERARELTIRFALGASRGAIIRQVMTENVLLSFCGAVMALGVAWVFLQGLPVIWPNMTPLARTSQIGATVLAFTFVVSLLCAVLVGLAPALRAAGLSLAEALRDGERTSSSGRRRYYDTIVLGEVALGLLLLVGAGLMCRTLWGILHVSPGFEPKNVMTFQISLPGVRYPDYQRRINAVNELRQKLEAIPGVRSAGAASHIPFSTSPPNWYDYYWKENAPAEEQNTVMTDLRSVTPGYLKSMGVSMVAGRDFDDSDDVNHPRVIIVDELLANRTWPGQDPIGQHLSVEAIEPRGNFGHQIATVVGVVSHMKHHSLMKEVRPVVFEPAAQSLRFPLTFAVETALPPESLGPKIREVVNQIDRDLPVANLRSMESYVDSARAQTRFTSLLAAGLAGIALFLACVGVYGVTALAVVQRTREIGIRMALGAEPANVLRMMVLQGIRPVVLGIIPGLLGAVALVPLLSSLLYGVKPLDPLTFAAMTLALLIASWLACYLPARRVIGIDPVKALMRE